MVEKAFTTSLVGSLAIAAALVVSNGANAEEVESTILGASATPTLTADPVVTAPNDVNLDSLGTGLAGRAFHVWIDHVEIACFILTNPTSDWRVVSLCQVTNDNGLFKQFTSFMETLDKFGSSY
ncbi:MAG: hypothetical protein ACREH6_13275 [Geminicoccaceae bacterium]